MKNEIVYVKRTDRGWATSTNRRDWVPLPRCSDAVDAINNAHVFHPYSLVTLTNAESAA